MNFGKFEDDLTTCVNFGKQEPPPLDFTLELLVSKGVAYELKNIWCFQNPVHLHQLIEQFKGVCRFVNRIPIRKKISASFDNALRAETEQFVHLFLTDGKWFTNVRYISPCQESASSASVSRSCAEAERLEVDVSTISAQSSATRVRANVIVASVSAIVFVA